MVHLQFAGESPEQISAELAALSFDPQAPAQSPEPVARKTPAEP